MARTTITTTALTKGGSAAEPAATNTGVGTGNGITIATTAPERTILRVTGTSAGTVSVKAGSGAAALAAGQGDLSVAVGLNAVVYIGPFESSRFKAADGTWSIDTSVAMAVQAFAVDNR